ncbi:recombinase RecT [Chitiniphilus eburneus]|uniref:DNA recombinase n=1 Tax=Chitiniphilus eburneus TaxID=2571148 RepID=A0A4U0Q3E0_9NEIS|nr:recombinase RecT [Chitiniphilus eburneus]TJZ75611.1 DNA recombinase [Chitiniphilus eburneus]
MSTQLKTFDSVKGIVLSLGEEFARVCSDKSINFNREAGFAVQLLQESSYLLETAYSNPDSLRNAVVNVAALGISLNPAKKQAYLVPRKNKNGVKSICLDISYIGLLHLAQQTGAIYWGKAEIVRERDQFRMTGLDSPPEHAFDPFAVPDDRGQVVGAYVVVKTCDGDYLTHTMPAKKINDIRDRSEAWKSGQKGPWGTDYEEMAKKTVVKQASKYWPHRERLQTAIHHLDTDGGEGVEKDVTYSSGVIPEPKSDEATKALVAGLEEAAKSGVQAFRTAWAALAEQQKADVGLEERNRINRMAKAPQGEVIEGDAREVENE